MSVKGRKANSVHCSFNSVTLFFAGSRHSRSAATNNELMEKIERMSELIDLMAKLACSSAIVSPLSIISVNYFVYGLGDESFRFQGTFWLPFDANTPLGFCVASTFEGASVFATAFLVRPIICLFIGTCWSVESFLKDIGRDISHLRKRKIANLNKQKITERFCNFVRCHIDVEELSIVIFKKNFVVQLTVIIYYIK